jgi:hypothetical protein
MDIYIVILYIDLLVNCLVLHLNTRTFPAFIIIIILD